MAGYEFVNPDIYQAQLQAVQQAAQLAYQYERMRLIDVPMLEIEKDRLALQAAAQAAEAKAREENIGLGVLNLAGSLRGPRNAFQQQNVMMGVDDMGLSNAVGAISGHIQAPLTHSSYAQPQGASIQSLIGDIYGAAGLQPPASVQGTGHSTTPQWQPASTAPGTGAVPPAGQGQPVGTPGPTPNTGLPPAPTQSQWPGQIHFEPGYNPTFQGTGPVQYPNNPTYQAPTAQAAGMANGTPNAALLEQYKAGLPDLNKIVGREWVKMPGDTQDFLLSAYEDKGYSGNDVLDMVKRGLPQFRAPSYGGVR